MADLTTFYLVRHGETFWNKQGIIQGHKDSSLTKTGVDQAKKVAEKLKDIKFDLIFSSDLFRAKRTAEIIKLERDLEIKTNKLLRERKFGHLEGTRAHGSDDWEKAYKKLTDKQKFTYKHTPQIESDEEIVNRLITFMREVAIANPRKKILVVTHGGIMRIALYKFGFANYKALVPGSVKNTGFIKIETDGVDFFIKEVSGVQMANQYA